MKRGIFIIAVLVISFFNIQSQEANSDKLLLTEMRLFRNEIFARHGRTFSSQDLKNYFNNQDWYKPTESFKLNNLSQKETLAANTIKNIENNYTKFSNKDKQTALGIFSFIKNHLYNQLDTLIYTIGDFDNSTGLDTVTTRIIEKEYGVIVLEYKLLRQGETIEIANSSNPYFWLGDNELFQEWDNHFFFGFLAVNNCQARSVAMWSPLDEEILKHIVDLGYDQIQEENIDVGINEYKQFIRSYKGNLIEHSQFEAGSKLQIWYEPINKFITFYAP
ncbi:YARHG domain-containing protein [Carboxylicivirga sp. A043]|uniref:YARHG domain-containing protein n=1 Tax=Carboxylicivirga litoralis TaxID=2816963 RepID=UPI0021CB737F|nr:YARHG domain-containing protein [Carboxylicivirga sp. A043]MCU4157029.1 YARHG domain-containing protein [Carboxylicivirga sp. A043]